MSPAPRRLFLLFVFRTVLAARHRRRRRATSLLLGSSPTLAEREGTNTIGADGCPRVDDSSLERLFDYLSSASRMPSILQPPVLRLVRNGEILLRNLRAYASPKTNCVRKLRKTASRNAGRRAAMLESDGTSSVIKREKGGGEDPKPPKHTAI